MVNVTKLRREALEKRYSTVSLPAADVMWLCDRIKQLEDAARAREDGDAEQKSADYAKGA